MVIRANFRTKQRETALEEFDFRMGVALDAMSRCKTKRQRDMLDAHLRELLAEAEANGIAALKLAMKEGA